MRVINLSSYPRVMGYANGRNVPSGGFTTELPITTLNNPALWKDINNGQASFRLSDADKEFLIKVATVDANEYKVQSLPQQHVPAVRTPAPPAKAISAAPFPIQGAQRPAPATPETSVLPIPGKQPSLADLKRMNAMAPSKLAEITQFMGDKG